MYLALLPVLMANFTYRKFSKKKITFGSYNVFPFTALKKKVKHFEENFEKENGYKVNTF